MKKDFNLFNAKRLLYSNVLHLKNEVDECVEKGMVDEDAHYHNELVDLLDDADVLSSWDELLEAVEVAKVLETDVNAWLARKGQTTLSLEWPEAENRS